MCATKKIYILGLIIFFITEIKILRNLSHSKLRMYYFAMKNSSNESLNFFVTKKNNYLHIEIKSTKNNWAIFREKKNLSFNFFSYYTLNYKRDILFLWHKYCTLWSKFDISSLSILFNISFISQTLKNWSIYERIINHIIVSE